MKLASSLGLYTNITRVNGVSECLKSESRSDRGSWLLSRVPVLLGETVEISLRPSKIKESRFIDGFSVKCLLSVYVKEQERPSPKI